MVMYMLMSNVRNTGRFFCQCGYSASCTAVSSFSILLHWSRFDKFFFVDLH